ncbi:MAG TPA: WG repeat-containing protein, partial [Cyclobacteriaceae bacterium]|nr:WG repeat-containing protein [Cyclobacteriaceae bacterium]
MNKIITATIILIIAIVVGCSVTSKNEIDKDVEVFLNDFQSKLKDPDYEIMNLFSTNQPKEEILKAIAILQNKDTSLIKSRIVLSAAKSSWVDSWLTVEIPVELINKGQVWHDKNVLYLKLIKRDGRYYVGSMDAKELYKHFLMMKDAIGNADALARRMADIKIYYDKAKELQKDYDSVIWFAHHKNMTYYYVVNGKYNFDSLKANKRQEFKMGLIDETGKVIVPVEFDLIGNPSMMLDEAVEVKKDGKIGYYSLAGSEIISASYDWLVPYEKDLAIALVKKDSTFGWLNKAYAFQENFPSSDAERSINEFEYLTSKAFTFGNGHQDLIIILYPFNSDFFRGNGMITPPAYFVRNGIQPPINDGFITKSEINENNLFQYGNEYEESSSEKPFSISKTLTAFVSNLKTRYIGGRGEFYRSHKIILMDKKLNFISSVVTNGDNDFEFKKLNDELFESKFRSEFWGPSDILEYNFPDFNYFRFDGHQLTELNSNRRFKFTEFLKIDSSYLSGYFITVDYVKGG